MIMCELNLSTKLNLKLDISKNLSLSKDLEFPKKVQPKQIICDWCGKLFDENWYHGTHCSDCSDRCQRMLDNTRC